MRKHGSVGVVGAPEAPEAPRTRRGQRWAILGAGGRWLVLGRASGPDGAVLGLWLPPYERERAWTWGTATEASRVALELERAERMGAGSWQVVPVLVDGAGE